MYHYVSSLTITARLDEILSPFNCFYVFTTKKWKLKKLQKRIK